METVEVCFRSIDENWDKEISNYGFDVYHLKGWLWSSIVIDSGKPRGVIATLKNKKIFFPIIVRLLNDGYWDATSPYGFGGPIVDQRLTNEEIDTIMYATTQFMYQQGCVSWFMRLHPILNHKWSVNVGSIAVHGPTLISDLTKSKEELWSETRRQHRQAIQKALKQGVTTKVEKMTSEKVSLFYKIYTETMQAVGANDYYYFNEDYFYTLCRNLPEQLVLFTAFLDKVAISCALCTISNKSKIIQYYLGGTLNNYRYLQPSKLLTNVIINWGQESSFDYLHLGGGVGATKDSLYNYKKGFSSKETVFKTYRIIINSEKYMALKIESGYVDSNSDFFPIYRFDAERSKDQAKVKF